LSSKDLTPQEFEELYLKTEGEPQPPQHLLKDLRVQEKETLLSPEAKFRRYYDRAFDKAYADVPNEPADTTDETLHNLAKLKQYKREHTVWLEMRPDGRVPVLGDKGPPAGLVVNLASRINPSDQTVAYTVMMKGHPVYVINQYPLTERMAALLLTNGLYNLFAKTHGGEPEKPNTDEWFTHHALAHIHSMALAMHLTQEKYWQSLIDELLKYEATEFEQVHSLLESRQSDRIYSSLDKALFAGEKARNKWETSLREGFHGLSLIRALSFIKGDANQSFELFKVEMEKTISRSKSAGDIPKRR